MSIPHLSCSCILVLASLALSACITPPPALTIAPLAAGEYRVRPPDKLLITIRPEPEITRPVVVRPDGNFSFDLIGEVVAGGNTVEEIRADIQRRIQQYIVNPDVTVTLEEATSRQYFVVGEVARVGAYPLLGRVTVVEGLASAGGETRRAALNSARLTRTGENGPAVYPIRFKDIMERADLTTNYELQPGDVIYVAPNLSAQIGYALQVIFFPFQQIIGLGGSVVRTSL